VPTLIAQAVSQAVSAATVAGLCTVTSTAGIHPGTIGYLTKAGTPSIRVIVQSVPSATTFVGRLNLKIDDIGYGPVSHPTMTGGSDLTAFNGGGATFTSDEQLVSVNADYTKLFHA
jgi:hypothetical protein